MAGLSVALLCALATTFAVVTFEPIRSFSEETASCLGAEEIERADFSNSDSPMGATAGTGRSMRGSDAYELTCTYPDGHVKQVSNNETVIKGIVLAFLVGLLPGFLIAFTVVWLGQRHGGDGPPATG